MDINILENLLKEYGSLPKNVSDVTFMEICRHSKSRFEEICSRILAFFINPNNEHGLRNLFLKSIFEIINKNSNILYDTQTIVETEAPIEGKFLDIIVYSDIFVLGIENKIGAEVYNPLDAYGRLIDSYKKSNTYKVVLSVRKITKSEEIRNIENNNFKILYYDELFQTIKQNIGQYYQNGNLKYITYLFDFIHTIENMMKSTIIDDPQSIFFFNNNNEIDMLVKEYEQHKQRVLRVQQGEIATLKEQISLRTGVQWWAWQGWDLGFGEFDKSQPRIGIESSYSAQDYDPIKVFRIYITTWNLTDWFFYEKEILKKYPIDRFKLDLNTNKRAYLHMDVIIDNDQDEILNKLEEYYNFIKEVVESKKK